ncbi:MAG: right-handed parallel beta-helix repeat-containing protein, partial [Candidatus Bipolaricaulia bacterium]
LSQADINNSTLSGNGDGIWLEDSVRIAIEGCRITSNKGYGVTLYQRSCFDILGAPDDFKGTVRGSSNVISGNKQAAVCPPELDFLMTAEGGEYP